MKLTYLGSEGLLVEMVGGVTLEAIFVHNPVSFLALGCSAAVEDECLLHAHHSVSAGVHDIAVLASGLPVPCLRGSVGAHASGVLAVPQAEKIPLLLPHFGFLCTVSKQQLIHFHTSPLRCRL